jgi:hypothetical protein
MITTIHGFSSPKIMPVYQAFQDRVGYVAISDADRAPSLPYIATIHHGIPLEDFPFSAEAGEGLLFYGRIHADKGAAEAIATAQLSGRRLDIAGIVQDAAYFAEAVAPHIDDDHIVFHGVVGGDRRAAILGGAKALLHHHAINAEEPDRANNRISMSTWPGFGRSSSPSWSGWLALCVSADWPIRKEPRTRDLRLYNLSPKVRRVRERS